jgi:hypothetical protein
MHNFRGVPVAPPRLARTPDERAVEIREMVDTVAHYLDALARFVERERGAAASARDSAAGPAAGARAFHQRMNQEVLGARLRAGIDVFEEQRRLGADVRLPDESPDQTRLGEAYARAQEQLGLALDEARTNAAGLAPADRDRELAAYEENHLRWLAANPAAPRAVGARSTFTSAEADLSARRHAQVSTEVANLASNIHEYNLLGDVPARLRAVLLDATYRLAPDSTTGQVSPEQDSALAAGVQPAIDQLEGIEWASQQAIERLLRAESSTRSFAADPAGNAVTGAALRAHFSTTDPGYATLLADRLARMIRELRGEGALALHARRPGDPSCGIGSIGGGSFTVARAAPNAIFFCSPVSVGYQAAVSTLVHEVVHAVIPELGATPAVTETTDTPNDRAFAYERIYSRLSTEEALANAESYSGYVDELTGVAARGPTPPQDEVRGCSDPDLIEDALARATYRIRLAAMWAGQQGSELPLDTIQVGFPGADEARALEVPGHLRSIVRLLQVGISVRCRSATDREARAGALVYDSSARATSAGFAARTGAVRPDAIRVCPAWFQASTTLREDTLTGILALRYSSTLPLPDVAGIVALVRHIQEQAQPVPSGRSLAAHQAADLR